MPRGNLPPPQYIRPPLRIKIYLRTALNIRYVILLKIQVPLLQGFLVSIIFCIPPTNVNFGNIKHLWIFIHLIFQCTFFFSPFWHNNITFYIHARLPYIKQFVNNTWGLSGGAVWEILWQICKMLQKNPPVRQFYANRWKIVLVWWLTTLKVL